MSVALARQVAGTSQGPLTHNPNVHPCTRAGEVYFLERKTDQKTGVVFQVNLPSLCLSLPLSQPILSRPLMRLATR